MGLGSYNYTSSATRAAVRADLGTTAFVHDVDARAGKVAKLHPDLDLTKKPRRESRDVEGKQPATPVFVVLDQTGSMSNIPSLVIEDMHKLMKGIVEKGIVTDPQVCFAAVGDASGVEWCGGEEAPVQVGEFEASDELAEKHLSNIFLEGRGGGGTEESYELLLYVAARQIDADAWEKYGRKGYMFILGDEGPYPVVQAAQIKKHIDPNYVGEDIRTSVIAEEAQEKWNIFLIRPGGSANFANPRIENAWKKLLPEERVINMTDWKGLVPMIAATLSVMGGDDVDDAMATLVDDGFDASALKDVKNALVPLAATATATAQGIVPVTSGAGLPATTRV